MMSEDSCGRICCRGMYSCYWRHPSDRNQKCSCCWLSVLTAVSILTLFWMYICLMAYNDRDDVNWKVFSILKLWVNWFMVLIIISAVLTIYCTLLLVFALFQLALKVPLDLHSLHKLFLFLGVVFVALGTTGISLKWGKEWHTVLLSLQATAPFLQMGGVGALTLVSWLVFQGFHRTRRVASKILIMAVFVGVSVAMFLSPLLIQSPCLVEKEQLPRKPNLIGHRGAPMLAPENTLMSFIKSVECGVIAFETDVQLSKDRVPYLMHDHNSHFLRRTTDVLQKFPGKDLNHSTNLTWEELQELNAGDWFLKTDPFRSVSQLSEQEKKTAGNQSVPSLLQLLDLAKTHNTSVIFDLKNDDNNDTNDTVNTILNSSIPQDLILWLPPKHREYVREFAPGFKQVYNTVSDMNRDGADYLNVKYSALSTAEIGELRNRNVTVNLWVVNEPWLFSLLWCSGASSVTTNACSLLKDMSQPDWTMRPDIYRIIWITVDLVSLLIMFAVFILQREKANKGIFCLESERTIPLLTL
ncbi:glycerophosphoinositol inositolphosphodiesterase GDPD2 isoform X1 [Coregonus clupeaformis]|uniref:glycerophosphoinositol inositolphosphodiesterase GDPD2 isoform X1 n=2 Tax=Coregonus clupeaformis TaxID=59861 RepID=UPI001BE0CEBE|nr:glycerophosphoinositol inositolphosphodiesterase GDPD2 isoform X1 [Coregonus clupeaformis]